MAKQIVLAGLLGGIVILAWLIVSRGPLPLSGDLPQPIANDKDIHTALKEKIVEPGIYYCPDSSEESRALYPDFGNEPLFTIFVSGRTPNMFMKQLVFELICIFVAPIVAAWMLSVASRRVLATFLRRALFVTSLGLFLAVYSNISSEKPIDLILLSSLNNMITWVLAGLVIAWRIRPEQSRQA